ncbi:MAG: O-antigen ligase family protein [Candidatus Omnitrophota bacterium]|nr:O-antigen ligase family protein [Candidatus Omnitrophota bacterium]
MPIKFMRFIFQVALYLAFALILISLGQMPHLPTVSTECMLLVFGALALGVALFGKREINLLFPWSFIFILWLCLQGTGQYFTLPFLETQASWEMWLTEWMKFLTGFAFICVCQCAFSTRVSLDRFLRYLVFTSTLLAFYFICLYYTSNVKVESIGVFPLLKALKSWGAARYNPNDVIDLFYPGFFFALSYVLYANAHKRDGPYPAHAYARILLYLCFACVSAAAIVFTHSRAGIIAFLGALFFYLILFALCHRRKGKAVRRIVILLGVFGAFMFSLGMKSAIQEMLTISAGIQQELELKSWRALSIGTSWQLVFQKGLFGVGLGNFRMGWLLYHSAPFNMVPIASFNDYLWIWVESGFLGVLSLVAIFVGALFRGVKTAISSASYFHAYFLLAAVSSLSAVLLHALVDYTFYLPPIFWMAMLMIGIGTVLCKAEAELMPPVDKKEPSGFPWHKLALPVLLMVTLISAGIAVCEVLAYGFALDKTHVVGLEKAAKLDPFHARYPEDLARYYRRKYLQSPNPQDFQNFIAAVDDAIKRNPFKMVNYERRASLFLKTGDERGIRNTFEQMRENLPQYYVGELVACGFYMESTLKATGSQQANRFSALALRHYDTALEYYPEMEPGAVLHQFMSREALTQFNELLKGSS